MAAGATMYRFRIALSDVDRGVYETLDLRVAQHPSEAERFLVARVLAYCLCYEPELAMSKGLSTAEEPAIWLRHADGSIALWIDIGTPGAERLHKASKASERVVVVTHNDPELLRRVAGERAIHRAEDIEVIALDAALLGALATRLQRQMQLELVRSDDCLYVTVGGDVLEGPLTRFRLG